jgi:hypothetical protein
VSTTAVGLDQLIGKGTLLALGGALVLALLAGVVAYVRR